MNASPFSVPSLTLGYTANAPKINVMIEHTAASSAGGFYGGGFDISYAASNSTENGNATTGGSATGFRPKANQWHHVSPNYVTMCSWL